MKKRKKNAVQEHFDTHRGYRFDHVNHSWVYLKTYVSLGYSYMTSLINKDMSDRDYQNED